MRIFITFITLALFAFGVVHAIQVNTQPERIASLIDIPSTQSRSVQQLSSLPLFKQTDITLFQQDLNQREFTEVTNDQEDTVETETHHKSLESHTFKPEDYLTDVSTHYVNSQSLNVRKGPSTKYDIIGVLKLNDAVDVSEKLDHSNWVAVRTAKYIGFIHSSYLSQVEIVTETKQEEVETEKNDSPAAPKSDTDQPPSQETEKPNQPPNNLANQLKTVANNHQIILVTTKTASSQQATIETFERTAQGSFTSVLKTSGFVGKNGITTNKKEGDGKTPAGKFSIGTAFGTKGNPGTSLSFRAINKDDVWVDDSESSHYNSWQSKSATEGEWSSAEDMYIPQYRYGFVINYNTNRVPYKGSAISFHVANNYTLGCVGTSEQNVIRILTWLNPSKSPVIIQTTEAGLTHY